MNEIFKKDITLRIVSILFAVLLWLYANPIEKRTFNIPLTVLNENSLKEKGITLTNNFQNYTVITVRGRADRIAKLREIDFDAVLDFSNIDSADDSELEIEGPVYRGKEEGITIIDVKTKEVKVELEEIEENPFRVEIVTNNAKLKDNYKIVKMTAIPDTISLQDRESLIDQVGSVKAFIDVKDLDRDKIFKQVCKIYNKNGKENTELARPTVEIRVEVAKEVPVVPLVKGTPAQDHVEGQKKVNPDKVLITGPPEILSKVNELTTEPVTIDNIRDSSDIPALIKLPEGIKLYDATREVTVNVAIEQLVEKEFNIANTDISINNTLVDNSLKYNIQTPNLAFKIKGVRQALDRISSASLKPRVDVDGLMEGTYNLPLFVTLPGTVKQVQEYTVEVKIERITGVE